MKKLIAILTLILAWNASAWAEGTQYQMRVDGLACPYCAYGVEKKLKQIKGVKDVEIDLDKGVVTVRVDDGVESTEPQMRQLFTDAGFTYRSMSRTPL